MQQFMVPQFIDVEDKIIGPITTRQFVLIMVAMLTTFLLYKLLSFIYFAFAGVLNLGIFAVFAFARVNSRPIHFFILNFVQTIKRPMARIWNREAYIRSVQVVRAEPFVAKEAKTIKGPVSGSRLRDLTLVVNTGGIYRGEEEI